jgi:putative thioredoxin
MSAQVNEVLKEADNLLNAGDLTQAAQLYANVLMEDNQNLHAIGAMIRIQVMLGEHESAKRYLAMVPEAKHSDPAIASARATLDLAEQSANIGELTALEEVVNKNPLDHQARFDLALALAAKNRKDEAIDHLLIIVKKDRTWNEDGARKQVIQFFDAWGAMDEATLTGRRKLSTALFS